MEPGLPPYFTNMDPRPGRKGPREKKLLRLALATALGVVVVVMVVLTVVVFAGDDTTASTSTTVGQTSSSSTATSIASTTTTARATTTTLAGVATYTASLTGENLVPPRRSTAKGTLTVTVAADGSSASYALNVSNLDSLTKARLHEGTPGADGGTILTIYDGPTRKDVFTGTAAEGAIREVNFEGPLKGKKIADLETLIKGGSVWLNVGTVDHRAGEICGQLE
ncbi:MAG: CHRD domain-containing protein [Thermoleophilia bacterium]|jgi:hypothetical protein